MNNIVWSQSRVVNGHHYTAEVKPVFRQYHNAARWDGFYDWSVLFENEYRPRMVYGTARGDMQAIDAARGALAGVR